MHNRHNQDENKQEDGSPEDIPADIIFKYKAASIPYTKTKVPKLYTIYGKFAEIARKYVEMRSENVLSVRFFINYRHGQCNNQVIGKNTIAKMPKQIATCLIQTATLDTATDGHLQQFWPTPVLRSK